MLSDEDVDRIAAQVHSYPTGAEVILRRPDGSAFSTLLPGVPRVGEVVWHPLRRNGQPKRFVVERVEWFTAPERKVEVVLRDAAEVGAAGRP